jgi:hypothetical protein
MILNIRLLSCPAEDFISWFYEKSGVFSVCSAYTLAKEFSGRGRGRPVQLKKPGGATYLEQVLELAIAA